MQQIDPAADNPYTAPQAPVAAVDDFSASSPVVYAGFWRRGAALFIDSFVVGIAYYAILIGGMFAAGFDFSQFASGAAPKPAAIGGVVVVVYVLYPLISGLYYVLQESSGAQATLGKRAVGIKVTDNQGGRLGRGHALGRWASHLLCYFTFYIGYIMAGFTDRKRGLHDMVASTLVVDRWAYTASPERQRPGVGGVAIAVLVVAALLVIAYIGVLLAVLVPLLQHTTDVALPSAGG